VSAVAVTPRLGFLGVGWIGRHRLEAVAASGTAEIAAVADPALPDALDSLDDLLEHELDAVVIATPSALHAGQAIAALEAGLAVFCQKPLARSALETSSVIDAARRADRLVGVDLSYRFTRAAQAVRAAVAEIGDVAAAELVFHNAYGPDRPWFYERELAGGGCVIDLGTHLVDLALWILGWPAVERVESRLLQRGGHGVEDYAVARLDLATGATVSLACSWNLPAGNDCTISAAFYGRDRGAALRNAGGSFYDLCAERYRGTQTETLVEPPDAWGGRAICDWVRRLGAGERYNPEVERTVDVAEVVDRIYGSAP
jgi:predicted dehydrogenase